MLHLLFLFASVDLVGYHLPVRAASFSPQHSDEGIDLVNRTSGGGLHEMGKGSVRAAIASEGYLSDDEFRLHDMHVHYQVFITKNDEHVEEISMKQ